MTQPVLEARGLVKTFGHVIGLAGVDLQLHAGEVLAIIGDNGSWPASSAGPGCSARSCGCSTPAG